MDLENLTDLLSDWENQSYHGLSPNELAQKILFASENLLAAGKVSKRNKVLWHRYLHITGKSRFLQNLIERTLQYRWAETTFKIIRLSEYTLLDMFENHVSEHPKHTLFTEISNEESTDWSYEQIQRHIREIATILYSSVESNPRVAIFSENNLENACCDLACLFYDILNTPLNIHFDGSTLIEIFDQLKINIAVTDTLERCNLLQEIRKQTKIPFRIFVLNPYLADNEENILYLNESCKRIDCKDTENILANRKRKRLDQVSTVMFTSGSTGKPKGICFSQYNIVTKRFARAAALPQVGDHEVLLCYLPLFHTFGRYLELLGSIYWGGTYVFPDNPSAETLIALFPRINPTGFISIPLRWTQLQEYCLEKMEPIPDEKIRNVTFRSIVGNRLRWGISAAGYLDPKIFHFFHRQGVKLCSGFGMTEATGGITMTPPDQYIDNTHGIPLPGARTRLGVNNELQVAGPYIGRYLDQISADGSIPYDDGVNPDFWLATGDVFRISLEGFYEIVDRIKDIYKNNKGQTIAPRKVEKKFISVPGIKHTFLIGDGKPYNTLFIVPEFDDSVLKPLKTREQQREYFRQIITSANQDLAPYERVINYTIINRNFDIEKNEITPKGTFNRKIIENNFKNEIEELYQSNYIELTYKSFRIRIPRWFFRDLGILEDDIKIVHGGLLNRRTGKLLSIFACSDPTIVQIGDLEYRFSNQIIDLGLFTRQPKLWIGNPNLIQFSPVREGWDVSLNSISEQILIPWKSARKYQADKFADSKQITNPNLLKLNQLVSDMYFSNSEKALHAVREIEKRLKTAETRVAELIRHRLEALARHPDENVRCLAYKILLIDEPKLDYSKAFPSFIDSGLTFLNKASIEEIAFSRLEKRRLDALRRRLFIYRLQLEWPVKKATRQQFINLFQLLVSFVGYHAEFYNSVRAELASWVLHRSDLELAKIAQKYFTKLFQNFEAKLEIETPKYTIKDWNDRLVFDDGLSRNEINRIKKVLIGTTFLKQSIMLAFDEDNFELKDVPKGGIWISRLQSSHYYLLYRMSINTIDGKHFDLQLVLRETLQAINILESVHWLEAVAGYPFGPPVLPRLGCYRPELGARSMVYLNEITVWGKIRQLSSVYFTGGAFPKPNAWRKLFVSALSAFFRGWRNSGNRIIPGSISPSNVVVPELDFRESATILSLVGWQEYKNTLSLINPMLQNFFAKTNANFPWCDVQLNVDWIFDACVEALGSEAAQEFFGHLKEDLKKNKLKHIDKKEFSKRLDNYIERNKDEYYKPLPLLNAIERYTNWEKLNPMATPIAMEQTINEVYHLYRLDRFPEIARYHLYRHTYFSNSDPSVQNAFDKLLNALIVNRKKPAVQFLELSDLQAALKDSSDRDIFSRMVFPHYQRKEKLEVLKIGESEREQVIVHSTITDKYGNTYTFRAPVEPAEIGQLYRIFFNENFPKQISEQDRHFVVIDAQEKVVGGICYQIQEKHIAQIEGTAVSSPIKERGIGKAIIEDFCSRMASQDIHVIKAHFFFRPFYEKLGFHVDKQWGALVKFLTPESTLEEIS